MTADQPAVSSSAKVRPPRWRAGLLLLVALGVLAGLPYVRGLPPLIGAVAATLLVLLVSLCLVQEWARFPLRPCVDASALVICLGLWYLIGLGIGKLPAPKPLLGAASSVSFLMACIFAGRLLALIVRERNLLLPVALVAGMADIFTVFAGPTAQALEHAPKLVEKLSVAIPQAGSAAGPTGAAGLAHVATAGLGDFIFLAFFLAGVYRFGLRRRLTFWVTFALMALGMAAVLVVPAVPALPLLPFIVTAFLLANAGAFQFSRAEKVQVGLALGLLAAALLAAGLTLTRP